MATWEQMSACLEPFRVLPRERRFVVVVDGPDGPAYLATDPARGRLDPRDASDLSPVAEPTRARDLITRRDAERVLAMVADSYPGARLVTVGELAYT